MPANRTESARRVERRRASQSEKRESVRNPANPPPTLAADEKHVRQTFESFTAHLRENEIDFQTTPLRMGRTLTIDPQTERSTDPEANRLFTREYRTGYELPRV